MACNNSPLPESNPEIKPTQNTPLFQQISSQTSGVTFSNDIEENEEINHLVWDACYYGGGVAIGDLNNDGLQDLVFSGNQVTDAVYINQGNFQFEDITSSSGVLVDQGWSNGVSLADVNGDGWLDIYVCRSGWKADSEMVEERRNALFINNGDQTFSEKAQEYGVDNEGYSTQAAWLDFDHDGDLDMFLLNAPSNNIPQKVAYNTSGFPEFSSDRFYRNDGSTFTDITDEAGVHAFSFGLGVVATDFNHDGWTDLYVANDYERPDYFYINNGDGRFTNQSNEKLKHTCYTAMGVDAADINQDALVDFAVLDMQASDHFRSKTNMPSMQPNNFWKWVSQGYNYQYMSNTLQLNNGAGYFSDIAQLAGISSTDWSWSVLMADFDNDSHVDIFVTNGINKDIRNNDFALEFQKRIDSGAAIDLLEMANETPSTSIPNFAFRNSGDLEFEKVAKDWGVDQPSFSYGAAYGDLDNDGDLDLVVANNNESPFIYANQSEHNWLKVSVDDGPRNSQGLGTKVVIFSGADKQYREISATRGYESASESKAFFGLGNTSTIDSVVVFFTDGKVAKQFKVGANQSIHFGRDNASSAPYNVYGDLSPLVHDVSESSGISFNHVENAFDDYAKEILLPHRQSRNGPFVVDGDINKDGLSDIFIGGAAGQPGAMFVQDKNGFTKVSGPWEKDKALEDMGASIVDVDNDGDNDLYVASGGGHLPDGDQGYTHRLYINEGGQFVTQKLKESQRCNASCVVNCDFDGDGDQDIFVGGRGKPGQYPHPGESILWINENGRLVDRTDEIAPGLRKIGMVTDATWADNDNDGDLDLVLVGEWMSPTIFENNQGRLSQSSTYIPDEHLSGWWFSISPSDLNGDGLMDYIVGNIGVNNKFHPSQDKPLKVYGADFDGNQTNDIVLAKCSKDTYVPVRGRECSSQQMPFVAEKFKSFESYAKASLDEIYGEGLDSALFYEVREFRSGVMINTGNGFDFKPFPNLAQISPIMSSLVHDVDGDGIDDIIIVGNHFDAEVETTRHDSGNGLVMLGNESGNYSTLNPLFSGFYAPGNAKGAVMISLASGGNLIVVANNNGQAQSFSCR